MSFYAIISVAVYTILVLLNLTFPGFLVKQILVIFILAQFFIFAKQKHLIYVMSFIILFPTFARIFTNTSNAMILLLACTLFLRYLVEKKTVVSIKTILSNPFFVPSLFILASYLIAWVVAFVNYGTGMRTHTGFLTGICCAIVMGYIIIGFVDTKKRVLGMQKVLLLVLVLNLVFAIIFFIKPSLRSVLPLETAGSVIAGSGLADTALRLGGLNFRWEGYAEYLMMVVVFLFVLLFRKETFPRYKLFIVSLFMFSTAELLLTNTRGAVVVTMLGLFIALMFFSKTTLLRRLGIMVIITIAFLGSLIVAEYTGHLRLFERFSNFRSIVQTKYGPMPAARAGGWVRAIDQIRHDRYLGRGPSFHASFGNKAATEHLMWPHNLILLILASTGIYGFFSYSLLFFRFLALRKAAKAIHDSFLRIFFLGLWLALLMFIIDELKYDGFLRFTEPYFYFIWLLIALMFSSANLSKKTSNNA